MERKIKFELEESQHKDLMRVLARCVDIESLPPYMEDIPSYVEKRDRAFKTYLLFETDRADRPSLFKDYIPEVLERLEEWEQRNAEASRQH